MFNDIIIITITPSSKLMNDTMVIIITEVRVIGVNAMWKNSHFSVDHYLTFIKLDPSMFQTSVRIGKVPKICHRVLFGGWLIAPEDNMKSYFDRSNLQKVVTSWSWLMIFVHFRPQVTQKLFFPNVPRFNGTFKFGDDLASIDIQRGRDYGLRSFNDYRQGCDLPKFNDFESMASVFGSDVSETIRF